MTIFRGCDNVDALRTVALPKSADINARISAAGLFCEKGYAPMSYNRSQDRWSILGICETIEEAAEAFDDLVDLYNQCRDILNPFDLGDMVIYASNGKDPRNPSNIYWYPCAIAIDE